LYCEFSFSFENGENMVGWDANFVTFSISIPGCMTDMMFVFSVAVLLVVLGFLRCIVGALGLNADSMDFLGKRVHSLDFGIGHWEDEASISASSRAGRNGNSDAVRLRPELIEHFVSRSRFPLHCEFSFENGEDMVR
jgi:hypothetical protein